MFPFLIGLGLLALWAASGSSGGSSGAASPVYKVGYKDGFLDGVYRRQPASNPSTTPAALKSGNAADYAAGYQAGYKQGLTKPPLKDPASLGSSGTGSTAQSGPGAKSPGTTGSGGSGGGGDVPCATADALKTTSLKDLQSALIKAGTLAATTPSGKPSADGICGEMTRAATRSFQSKNGLPATGTIDAATAAKLGASTARAPKIFQMVRKEDWVDTYLPGDFVITGGATERGKYLTNIDALPLSDGSGNWIITKVWDGYSGVLANVDKAELWVPKADGTWTKV